MRLGMVDYWNWRNRIAYAPPGEGNPGGNGDDTLDANDGDDTLDGSDSDDDTEINLDGVEAISKLFADTGTEDDEDDDSGEIILTADQVKEYLDEGLKKVVFPESMIPEDFNPNDRKSISALMSQAMQLGAKHSLNLMFRPVENAMKSHAKEVRTDVKNRVGRVTEGTSTEKFLAKEIPASQNPKYSALINTAWSRALEVHPDAKDRAKALTMVKQGLKAMSINLDDSGDTRRRGESGGTLKTGVEALDAYAPKPRSAGTTNAMRRS